jgi:hypothetical protein
MNAVIDRPSNRITMIICKKPRTNYNGMNQSRRDAENPAHTLRIRVTR